MQRTLLLFAVCTAGASAFILRCSNPCSIRTAVQRLAGRRMLTALDRQEYLQQALAVVPLILVAGEPAYAADKNETPAPVWTEPEVTEKGFMDISIGGEPVGRLVIALYGGVVPSTVKNFVSLLTGDNPDETSYKGTTAYKVLDGLNIQMGAIGSPNGKDGKAASGNPFPKENFDITHGKEGILSMVNNVDGNNDSRFFITVKEDSGWADNRYVAFGRVMDGMDVVRKIEKVKVEGGTNVPKKAVVIDDCGLFPVSAGRKAIPDTQTGE